MLYNTPDNNKKSFLRKQDHFINPSVNLCRPLLSANNYNIYPLPWAFFKDDETKKIIASNYNILNSLEENQGVEFAAIPALIRSQWILKLTATKFCQKSPFEGSWTDFWTSLSGYNEPKLPKTLFITQTLCGLLIQMQWPRTGLKETQQMWLWLFPFHCYFWINFTWFSLNQYLWQGETLRVWSPDPVMFRRKKIIKCKPCLYKDNTLN